MHSKLASRMLLNIPENQLSQCKQNTYTFTMQNTMEYILLFSNPQMIEFSLLFRRLLRKNFVQEWNSSIHTKVLVNIQGKYVQKSWYNCTLPPSTEGLYAKFARLVRGSALVGGILLCKIDIICNGYTIRKGRMQKHPLRFQFFLITS